MSLLRRCTLLLLTLTFLPSISMAKVHDWETRNGQPFAASLLSFDFESKTAEFSGYDGDVFRLPVEDLSFTGKTRLLVSRAYHSSFPEEHSPEKICLILVAIGLPAVFHLVAFWLSGLLITGRWNPVRAMMGWAGTILLGGFMVAFYLYMASLSSESSTGLFVFGSIVSLIALSLFVSVIFKTSTWKGGLVFVFHFVVAIALFFFASLTFRNTIPEPAKHKLGDQLIFRPVGLID